MDQINFILKDAVVLILMLTSMVMLPILAVGLIVGIFQAATQIQEMTLSFIPKIVVLFVILLMFGPLMKEMWIGFAVRVISTAMTL